MCNKLWSSADFYGQSGMRWRQVRRLPMIGSIIELRVKTTADLISWTASKVNRYMLPSFIYPIRSTKLVTFSEKERVTLSMIGHALRLLSVTLTAHCCSVSNKIYGLQHFWYNVVIARFSRFKIEHLANYVIITAAHRIYWTLTKVVHA